MPQYQYTRLADLERVLESVEGNKVPKVNLYAYVVEVSNSPQQTDASSEPIVVTEIKLRDDSQEAVISARICSTPLESFSDRIQSGQIIRMHRAIVTKVAGDLKVWGQLNNAGFAILLFGGRHSDDFIPLYHSSAKFTLGTDYKERVTVLRQLFSANQPALSGDEPGASTSVLPTRPVSSFAGNEELIKNARVRTVNEVQRGGYFDAVVQAISVFTTDRRNLVLRCWDASLPPKQLFHFNDDFIYKVLSKDEQLEALTKNYNFDVIMYDEHAEFVKNNVKPRDILLLVNVHYYCSKNSVDLTMHGGGKAYKRSITILSEDMDLRIKLTKDIEAFIVKQQSEQQRSVGSGNDERSTVPAGEQEVPENAQNIATGTKLITTTAVAAAQNEVNREADKQKMQEKQWAGERIRQIQAVQLGHIVTYGRILRMQTRHSKPEIVRARILASTAHEIILQHILKRLSVERNGLPLK